MRVEINRNECPNAPAELTDCIRCVERFINYPVPYERHCFRAIECDSLTEVSIQIRAVVVDPATTTIQTTPYPISRTDWLG